MKTVNVTAKDGVVAIQSAKSPESGYIRVETVVSSLENGWLTSKKRSALIKGKYEALLALGLSAGSKMPGTIIRKESTTPFKPGQEAAINPTTKAVLTCGGQPIYAENFYTSNQNASDEILSRDKVSVLEVVAHSDDAAIN